MKNSYSISNEKINQTLSIIRGAFELEIDKKKKHIKNHIRTKFFFSVRYCKTQDFDLF